MEYKLCDWTCERIEALTADQRLALAQRVAGNLMPSRALLGRFLLVIRRTESYENCGANSVIQFASLQLGLEERGSREVLLVARRLESLPARTDAVERNLVEQSSPSPHANAGKTVGCWRPRRSGGAGPAASARVASLCLKTWWLLDLAL